jgi:hypothetical protein
MATSKNSSSQGSWGVSHLSGLPVTVTYALIIVAALIVLFLLRHFFGSIRVGAEGGVR